MKRLMALVSALLVFGFFLPYQARAVEQNTILVSAAVSLTNAFTELGGEFEKENTGAKVVFNFGASGTLLAQLSGGGLADLFVTADLKTMDKAADKGLIDQATRKNFAANHLVMAVPSSSAVKIKSAKELANPEVRKVAIGDPAFVPAGRYAKRYLEGAGLWEAVGPKTVTGSNVRQVLDYIERGEVEAGFVYATDATTKKQSVVVTDGLEGSEKVLYPFAVLKESQNRSLALRFQEFALGSRGREILKKYGFLEP